jgi:hypothetical protein
MQTSPESKYEAVKTLARVRGIKEFSPMEAAHITELCNTELDARTILDEVTDAPKYRTERAIKSTRSTVSNIFGKLSEAFKPE